MNASISTSFMIAIRIVTTNHLKHPTLIDFVTNMIMKLSSCDWTPMLSRSGVAEQWLLGESGEEHAYDHIVTKAIFSGFSENFFDADGRRIPGTNTHIHTHGSFDVRIRS